VANFGYVVTRSQVLNAWRKGFVDRYMIVEEDQLESSRRLVSSLREEAGCEEVQYDGGFYYLFTGVYGFGIGNG
jgi:hypothetical protein